MSIQNLLINHTTINQHAPIFHELIELLTSCLKQLGYEVGCAINRVQPDCVNVIIGHTMFLPPDQLANIRNTAKRYIVFQLEALDGTQGFASKFPAYFDFLRGATQVWEYASRNVPYLAAHGVTRVHQIPVGYSPRLERVVDNGQHDIDVLFFGAVNPRRQRVLDKLRGRGFRAESLFGVYGSARDAYIARAKIQLNMHQFKTSQLEQLRISYLLNNKRFVISESSTGSPYGNGVVFCDYNDLAFRCAHFLKPGMAETRMQIAHEGYVRLKEIPMESAIAKALAAAR